MRPHRQDSHLLRIAPIPRGGSTTDDIKRDFKIRVGLEHVNYDFIVAYVVVRSCRRQLRRARRFSPLLTHDFWF